jgi:hypothetical protein
MRKKPGGHLVGEAVQPGGFFNGVRHRLSM